MENLELSNDDQSESFKGDMLHLVGDWVKGNSVDIPMDRFMARHGSMEVVESIANHSGPNIEHVGLHGFFVDLKQCSDKPNKENILRLMGQLKGLTLHHSQLFNSSQIFDVCSKLTIIRLWNIEMDTSTLNSFVRKYPLLQQLLTQQENIPTAALGKLIELNPTIQSIKLLDTPLSQEVIDIVSRLPELTELMISCEKRASPEVKLNPLGNIAKLKHLHLLHVDIDEDLLDNLARNKSLISLELYSGTVLKGFQKQLAKLENLQILKIVYVELEDGDIPIEDMFPYLINELPKLRIINVKTELTITYEDLSNVFQCPKKDADCLILWNCYYGDYMMGFATQNFVGFGPFMKGEGIPDFNIDLCDDVSAIVKTARDFAAGFRVVRLCSAMLEIMQFD